MQELLYLTHRIPFPPNKGDKIRSYHLLKHLSQHYRVHLGTFIDTDEDWQYINTLKESCGETCFIKLNPELARMRCFLGLFTNRPLTLPYYWDKRLLTWVDSLLETRPIDKIVVFSSAMAQYVQHVKSMLRIIDFVDIDSDKWQQYAKSKSWPVNVIYQRESRMLLRYEKQITHEFDHATFVSEKEANLFKQFVPNDSDKVAYFNNGVDTEYFSPLNPYPNPYSENSCVLVFTGAMDYWANVDAVTWFAYHVFPIIRTHLPHIEFYIVGSRPTDQVLTLAKKPGITVTGGVVDIRPYLVHASLAVAPLRIARGIQNKVLEGMAMEKVVIASPQAMEGINAITGKEIFVANNETQFAQQITALLKDEDNHLKIAKAARYRILSDYSWSKNLARIDALLSLKSEVKVT